LKDKNPDIIKNRITMLIDFFKSWSRSTKYVDVSQVNDKKSLAYCIFNTKHLIMQSILDDMIQKEIDKISTGYNTSAQASRRKAMVFADAGKVDHEGKYTIFGQVNQCIWQNSPDFSCFRQRDPNCKAFEMKFLGEGSIDAGGPFREAFSNIAAELMTPALPLLIKSPNNRTDFGNYRDCYVVNPVPTTPATE